MNNIFEIKINKSASHDYLNMIQATIFKNIINDEGND